MALIGCPVNVGQFGTTDKDLDRYKQAGEYALEAKMYRDDSLTIYNELKSDDIQEKIARAEDAANRAETAEIHVADMTATVEADFNIIDGWVKDMSVTPYGFTAVGGEVTVTLPSNFTKVSSIYINGGRQEAGDDFTYNTTTHVVTFAYALQPGDRVSVLAGTVYEQTSTLAQTLQGMGGADYVKTGDGTSVQQALNSLFIEDQDTIQNLRSIKPTSSVRVKTRGAFSAFDGGSGDWFFDITDQTSNVTNYPRLFIAPDSDLTGGSGAWRLNIGSNIPSISYGLGLTTDKTINKEILEQISSWNLGRKKVILPATSIRLDRVRLKSNPNWEGTFGATASSNGGSGTVFMFETVENNRSALNGHISDLGLTLVNGSFSLGATLSSATDSIWDDSTGECYTWGGSFPKAVPPGSTVLGTGGISSASWKKILFPCISVSPSSGRITGLSIRYISIVGKDFFDRNDITTFAKRTDRQALFVKNTGGQVDLKNIFTIGFTQAFNYDEMWDGSAYGLRALYSGSPDGSIPAIWMGSTSTDNTNNMKFYGLHTEFCPYGIYVGLCRNVHFYGLKHESARQDDATHWGINVSIGALEVNITDSMFVTTHTTLQPLVLNQGIRCKISGCHFISRTPDSTSKYPGVIWYLGNRSSLDTCNVIENCKFTFSIPSDGVSVYPVRLGNYEQATNLRFAVPTNVTYQGGTKLVDTSGFLSCGYGSVVNGVSVNANSNPKTGGSFIKYDGAGARVCGLSLTEGTSVYSLFSGDNNNHGESNYDFTVVTDKTSVDLRGYKLGILGSTSSTPITSFSAFAGQEFNLILNTGTVTLVHSPSLVLLSGSNINLTGNKVYKFACVNSSGKCIQIS